MREVALDGSYVRCNFPHGEAIALHEGKEVALPIDQLVEGDLVRFGDLIYADGVLLEGELKGR